MKRVCTIKPNVLKDGNSPLHIACKYGHLDIVGLLLASGADFEAINEVLITHYELSRLFTQNNFGRRGLRHFMSPLSSDMKQ